MTNHYREVSGYITQEKYIKYKNLPYLESLLGFARGRFKEGILIAALVRIPDKHEFELAGYTQVADKVSKTSLTGVDVNKLKEILLKEVFAVSGERRLIKIIPATPHSHLIADDLQYPPGLGVPQWKLIKPILATVVANIRYNSVYA